MTKSKRMNACLLLSLLAVGLVGITGCGGPKRPAGFPPIYPLTVHVTQEGQSLDDAVVTLISTDGKVPWVVGGVTNAEGKAKMKTHGQFEGAPEGSYNVTITKISYEKYDEYKEAVARNDTAAVAAIDVKMWQHVEDKYGAAKTTPIKVDFTKASKVLEVDAGPAVKISKPFVK